MPHVSFPRGLLLDLALVTVFGASYVLVLVLLPHPGTPLWWWPALVSIPAMSALLLRRYVPWMVLVLLVGVTIVFTYLRVPVGPLNLAILVSVYSVCVRSEPAGAIGAAMLAMVWPASKYPLLPPGENVLMIVGSVVNLVMVVGWGRSMRVKRKQAAQLERTVSLLDQARDQLAVEAASAERARIAREFHDIVSHNLSVVALRAGVARSLVDRNPEHARETLRELEETSRSGMEEMRNLLSALRRSSGPVSSVAEHDTADDAPDEREQAARRPAPRLDDVDALLASVRDTGVTWRLDRRGAVRDLGPGVEMTAYRIVQEAVTNVLKHAGSGYARVLIDYREANVRVEISNHATRAAAAWADEALDEPVSPLGGHGLIGLRERVSLHGGALTAHPVANGFHLSAVLPCPEISDLV